MFQVRADARGTRRWNNRSHPHPPTHHDTMADRRDRPPVLRVLVLLVALVSTALALAALSPQGPEAAAPVVKPAAAGQATPAPGRT